MSIETRQSENAEKAADPRIHLAVERTELALERTHLAWIRTTFSIMTAGIAIDKGFAYIHEQRVQKDMAMVQNAHFVGLFLTSFGTILLLVETLQFVKRSKQLALMKMRKAYIITASSTLGILVLLLGFLLVYLMLTTG